MLQACQTPCHELIYRFRDGLKFFAPSHSFAKNRSACRGQLIPMKSADAENTELLSRIAQGDEAAFSRFYDQFAHGLYSLVYKILNDEKETEDVLQEGFTQIWKKAATYDGNRSSAFTWAVMIMRNKAIDHIRSRQRQNRVVEEAALETSQDQEMQEDDAVAQNEKRLIVLAALKNIPREQRQAIDLAFFSGLTQMQIAGKLGEPLGTVKARIRRGLLKLRESLDGNL